MLAGSGGLPGKCFSKAQNAIDERSNPLFFIVDYRILVRK